MKKLLASILSLILILSSLPLTFFAIAADESDIPVLYGDNAFVSCKSATVMDINGTRVNAVEDIKFSVNINVSDCSSTYSFIYLNGEQLCRLVDGDNIVELSSNDLKDGKNELAVYLGHDYYTYTNEDVYGSVNIDDITVESVTFSGVDFEKPESMNMYMPIVDEAGTTLKNVPYADAVKVGDGWFADTGMGGSTPENPVFIGYVFEKPDTDGIFYVDTTKIPDGKYNVVFTNEGENVDSKEYIIDNTAPKISFSQNNGAKLTRFDKIDVSFDDLTLTETAILIDGVSIEKVKFEKLAIGSHTAFASASDRAGNKTTKMILFELVDKNYTINFADKKITGNANGDSTLYSADLLKTVYMYENRYGEINQDYLRSSDEVLVSFNDKENVKTTAIGNSVPYQSFVVDTEGNEKAVVSYTGETGNGSGIVLKAWNYIEKRFDVIGKAESGESVTINVDLETYSYDNKMRINAIPDIVYNGSDTILWNSDTQYYSRFEDLNEFYYKVNQYAADEYKKGNIGYCVHTGDLVDQTFLGDEIANTEFAVADKAHDILDNAKVPNGVVSGNHDVVHETADYNYYYKYFGEDRYKDFDWYGGSLNNNMHHYDLVSIGAHDFVFLYLGCYKEVEEDTIAWANAVCQKYPNRNVIVCTHEYLLPSGEYSGDRAEVIWDKIIVPNNNIVMVLCGHNDGVCNQFHQVGDTDRYVLEILADYQFSELGVGPQHVLNGYACDGEGFIRLMTFNEAGQVITTTYSPVAEEYGANPYNFFPSYSDSFVHDLKLVEPDRSIKTTEFNVVVNPKEIGTLSEEAINVKKYDAVYAEIKNNDKTEYSKVYVVDSYKSDYSVGSHTYQIPETEKVYVTGYENVSENFRYNEKNTIPNNPAIEMGLNLLPDDINKLVKSSGTSSYTLENGENGAYKVTHEQVATTHWITFTNNIYQQVDLSEYNRLYFGVTAGKDVKWNIIFNYSGGAINFSQTADVASLFGYVNHAPSDITGTWNGYIDLSNFTNGLQTVNSINIVAASPGESVTFDYIFLAKSNGGQVRFITTDKIISSFDGTVGSELKVPDSPFRQGYVFEGWYTEAEGGQKVENTVKVIDGTTEIYARFKEKTIEKRDITIYDKEVELHKPSIGKAIFVFACVAFMLFVVVVLMIKIKKTKTR